MLLVSCDSDVQKHLRIRYTFAACWSGTIRTHLDLNLLLKHELMLWVEFTVWWSIMNKDGAERCSSEERIRIPQQLSYTDET